MSSRMSSICQGFILALLPAVLVNCAEGHCRKPTLQPDEAKPVSDTESQSETVLIYKYDGSLQCKPGHAIPLDTMARELEGIPIISSAKKRDGQMHIALCGSATDMTNSYEIPSQHLRNAESKGFKRWDFK